MDVDHTSGHAERVEDQQPIDRPTPPPPPDNPGAEPEGVPSRADSRAAAAAANKPDTSKPVEDKPASKSFASNEPAAESTAVAPQDADRDQADRDQLDDCAQEVSAEHDDTAEPFITDEPPAVRDVESEPREGSGAIPAFDVGAGQQPSALTTSSTEDTPVDERAPTQAAITPEAGDHPAPTHSENVTVDEVVARPRATYSSLLDDRGNEPEGVPSRADNRAGVAVVNSEPVEKSTVDDTDGTSEQADGTGQATEIPSPPTDAHTDANDQFRETPQLAKQRTAAEWPWADEFAARAEARENVTAANAEMERPSVAAMGATEGAEGAVSSVDVSSVSADAGADDQLDEDERTAGDKAERVTPPEPGEGQPRSFEEAQHANRGPADDTRSIPEIGDENDQRPDDDDTTIAEVDGTPTGERLVKPDDDKRSRAERARQQLYESVDEVHDITSKSGDSLQALFGPKTAGHPETRTSRPVYAPEHYDGIDAGDVATALLVVGVMAGEGFRALMGHSRRRRKGADNAGDR